MRMRSVVAAGALALTGLLATSGIAGAERTSTEIRSESGQLTVQGRTYDFCRYFAVNGEWRGRGCWAANGDHVLAQDINADGWWIKVDWHTDYGRDGKCSDGSSKGNGNDCNYNMDEDGRVRLQVEVWDENHQVVASTWTDYLPIGQ